MAVEPEEGGELAHGRLQSILPVRAKTRRRGSWHKPIRTQPDAAALEFAQAESTAAAVKERRGDKGDDTMSGATWWQR